MLGLILIPNTIYLPIMQACCLLQCVVGIDTTHNIFVELKPKMQDNGNDVMRSKRQVKSFLVTMSYEAFSVCGTK
jgi:hypothetical protein